MSNDQGNPGQNPWPQQPAGQQPYPQQPAPQQPYPAQSSGAPPYSGQPYPQQPYPQQPSGQPPYGQPEFSGQPYGQAPGPSPYGQQYGGPPAGQRPKRSLREPLVGAISVVVVAVALTILNTLGSLTFGFGFEYIGQRLVYVLLPIAFAALAFVGAAFISPIERATTRSAFLRSALIAVALGAAALLVITTLFTLFEDDFLGGFIRNAIIGALSQSIEYSAVFVAAILIDRLGRNRTS
jgi:hypothetical protein